MSKRIFLLEDDKNLVHEAEATLGEMYKFHEVPLSQANSVEYWRGLALTGDDIPIIDLNLKSKYSGLDVIRLLQREKSAGALNGLEHVLVATSLKGQVAPGSVSPDLAFVDGFRVYGVEKGVDAARKVDVADYGTSLASMIGRIYAGTATPLNR